jgi:hypothetical protein
MGAGTVFDVDTATSARGEYRSTKWAPPKCLSLPLDVSEMQAVAYFHTTGLSIYWGHCHARRKVPRQFESQVGQGAPM